MGVNENGSFGPSMENDLARRQSMISKTNPLASESQISGKQPRLNCRTDAFLRFVHEPGSVVYVFVKDATVGPARRLVGYYDTDHLEDLSRDVQQYSGRATGIYYSLNPVDSSCLDRAKNCLKPVWNASSADESDILHRRLMLIDIDPVREPDCSATHDEQGGSSHSNPVR
jgi:hypothetical protein